MDQGLDDVKLALMPATTRVVDDMTYPKREIERKSNAAKVSCRERKPRTRYEVLD
jgi:hypothetical protein